MQAEAVVEPIIQALTRRLTASQDVLRYMLAGNSTFTVRSIETQKRYTFKVVSVARALGKQYKKGSPQREKIQKDNVDKYWVRLLVGPDNNNSFIYIGMLEIFKKILRFHTTKASYASVDAHEMVKLQPSGKALDYVMQWLQIHPVLTPKIEFWHSGRCGMCGKKLTVPESVDRGIGPDCAGRL